MMITRLLREPIGVPELSRLKALDWGRVGVWVPFVWLLWASLPLVSLLPTTDGDSAVYLAMASGARHLFGDLRPATVAVTYKALGGNLQDIAVAQLLFALIAWSLLAVTVARQIRAPWFRPVAAAAVLWLALSPPISNWHHQILSESISMSLFALTVAGILWLLESWHRWKAVALVAVIALWVFSRDTNAFLCAGIALACCGAAVRHGRGYGKLGACCLLVALLSMKDASAGQRWVFPFYNSLGQRILTSPAASDFFTSRGMPMTPALQSHAGQWASGDGYWFYHNKPLHNWTLKHGKSTYARWLVSDPSRLVSAPLSAKDEVLSLSVPESRLSWLLWLSGALLAAFAALWRYRRAVWLLPGLMLAAVPALALLCYWGDPMEIGRHCLLTGVMWWLAVVIGWVIVVDSVWLVRRDGIDAHT